MQGKRFDHVSKSNPKTYRECQARGSKAPVSPNVAREVRPPGLDLLVSRMVCSKPLVILGQSQSRSVPLFLSSMIVIADVAECNMYVVMEGSLR